MNATAPVQQDPLMTSIAAAGAANNPSPATVVPVSQPAQTPVPYQSPYGALTAPNGSAIAAPTGAQQSANGLWYLNGQAYSTAPVTGGTPNYASGGATMNANISNSANSNTTIAPPAVVTSSTATTDLANKQTQTNQLNQDAQTQAATKSANAQASAAAAVPPATTEQGGTSTDQTDKLQSSISDLIGSLNDNETTINNN